MCTEGGIDVETKTNFKNRCLRRLEAGKTVLSIGDDWRTSMIRRFPAKVSPVWSVTDQGSAAGHKIQANMDVPQTCPLS
jgi:hypothetical protein